MSQETKKTSMTTADRPHNVSIVLSLIAVAISCLSWWESHQVRRSNEAVNRPVLSVGTPIIQGSPVKVSDNTQIRLMFFVPLKNTGNVTGKIVSGNVVVKVNQLTPDDCQVNLADHDSELRKINQKEMLPGLEEVLVGQLVVNARCLQMGHMRFRANVAATYIDVSSGQAYSQAYTVYHDLNTDEFKARIRNRYGDLWNIGP